MTTKTISGTYSAGYLLSTGFNAVTITASGSVGGFGLVTDAFAAVTNLGHLEASGGADGVNLVPVVAAQRIEDALQAGALALDQRVQAPQGQALGLQAPRPPGRVRLGRAQRVYALRGAPGEPAGNVTAVGAAGVHGSLPGEPAEHERRDRVGGSVAVLGDGGQGAGHPVIVLPA